MIELYNVYRQEEGRSRKVSEGPYKDNLHLQLTGRDAGPTRDCDSGTDCYRYTMCGLFCDASMFDQCNCMGKDGNETLVCSRNRVGLYLDTDITWMKFNSSCVVQYNIR